MKSLGKKFKEKGIPTGDMVFDEEHQAYSLPILDQAGGKEKVGVDWNLKALADFQNLRRLRKEIPWYRSFPVTVQNEQKSYPIENPRALLQFFLEEGKRGLTIQRYKGLGEMNPQQLWHTTMNPENRTILKIRVEDMVEADQIFTILMCDQVEPRRDFIYQNALEVLELDI